MSNIYSVPNAAKALGITPAQVRRLIKRHNISAAGHYQNPHYNSGPLCPLYSAKDLGRLKRTKDLREIRAKSESQGESRKLAAQAAVETKRRRLQEYVDNLEIDVPIIPKEELIQRARSDYSLLEYAHRGDPSVETMCVNYLRHCCTKYESVLSEITGKTGAGDAYFDIKDKVLDAIADAYWDWLADECDRQSRQMYSRQLESI